MPDPAESLALYNTCILSDAVNHLGLHLSNEGFTRPGLRRLTPGGATIAGYAATARIRSSDTPITGRTYFQHTEWWAEIDRLPRPRLVVIEDIDDTPGLGACVGEIAAAAFRALHCAGAVTNGSCRDLAAVSAIGFDLFAAHVSPSRAYAHLVDHGSPVTIAGLLVRPGDLLVADCHGVLSLPAEHAARICELAADLANRKRTFVQFCASQPFSIGAMEEHLRGLQL
ncbi:MAG: RraA family protein [Acidobacteriota bacterium]